MRVCYLLQTHTAPAQIVRLAHTLKRSSPEARVFIAHDACRQALDPSRFAALDGVTVLNRTEPVQRGALSMLDPWFAGAERLCQEPDWEWLVYLSGQDYPVRPLAEIEAHLATTSSDGLMRHWDARTGAGGPWGRHRGRRRYFCRYRRLPERSRPFLRLLRWLEKVTPLHFYLQYGAFVGWPTRHTPFSAEFPCQGGIQWHSLRRGAVEFLLAARREQSPLFEYYARTMVSDESLAQTVLVNSGRFRLAQEDRRYVTQADRDGHPRVLDVADYPVITGDGFDFARKFDLRRDAVILDQLDVRIFAPAGAG